MEITVREIAHRFNGRVVGDENVALHGVAPFAEAGPKDLAFAVEGPLLNRLDQCRAAAVMVPEAFSCPQPIDPNRAFILCSHPKSSFFKVLSWFHPENRPRQGISPAAVIGRGFSCGTAPIIGPHVTIGDGVTLGDRVWIMAGVFVGDDVTIGDDTVIKPNVSIMAGSRIGARVVMHPGSVIGSDGFGFTRDGLDHEKIPHAGFVQIEDDVEIGACNTIDRGTMGRTLLERGVKTDNLIHIAHNVRIGARTLVAAQAGIAGSATIEDNVIIAGKAGISGHLTVGEGAIVGPAAGVTRDVPPGEIVSGIPHMPHKLWLKTGRILPRLPEMRRLLLSLERKINAIEQRIKSE